MDALLKLVILGRPNVGKSSLFNRLIGKKLAIVHDQPGVTRDWREGIGKIADLQFTIYDTAGLDGFESPFIKEQINYQTTNLIQQADLLLFVVDAREGMTKSEDILAQQVRHAAKPCIIIANKCESQKGKSNVHDFYRLGLGDPLAFSAEHGDGLDELYQALIPYFHQQESNEDNEPLSENPLRLAIVGRPNVGKSTLTNALIGETRLLTGDQPGITRDAVTVFWEYERKKIHLIDTAGLRKRARIEETLEKSAAHSSLIEIQYANVVILTLDAQDPLNKQDLTIASHVIEEGRGLVIALNKWDCANQKEWPNILHKLEHSLSQVKGVPIIPISALKGRNLDKLMKSVFQMYELWERRIPTAKLNQWLAQALERHPPPLSGNTRVRLKYVTQVKTRPPTFAIFASKPVDIPDSYQRYLMTSLRENFDMPGVPIRLLLRKGKNPYLNKKSD